MAGSPEDPRTFVTQVRLVGRGSATPVKALAGFKKGRHTVPDSVNRTTLAFLGRLVEPELAEEAESWFRRARTELGYKRRGLTLEMCSPSAVLTAVDFTFEIEHGFEADDASMQAVTRTMHNLVAGRLGDPVFERLFAGQFDNIVFDLVRGVQVEAVIDAIEELDGEGGLRVDYPPDCRDCELTVAGIDAVVHCDGGSLAMKFPRMGGPAELVHAFGEVRRAFGLSRKSPLAGLLGGT